VGEIVNSARELLLSSSREVKEKVQDELLSFIYLTWYSGGKR
jgi:hypothetical protein